MRSLRSWLAISGALSLACSRTPPPSSDPQGPATLVPPPSVSAVAVPPGAAPCSEPGGPACLRFPTPEEAFRWVLSRDPLVLAVGEAHAPKEMENIIPSSTRRFAESLLPILAPRSSDVVVELWAPDPKCTKAVKQVASAQRAVTDVQASSNQNEYVTLGTKAKDLGMTPWLLRPTCDDFSMLADAGDDAMGAMLALVKRLTEARVSRLYERNKAQGAPAKTVVAYGGALHNDLSPPDATREYSFGPALDRLTGGRYVELDIIVPEFVKRTPTWEKLPWYASFEAERARSGAIRSPMLYTPGKRSFVLVFASQEKTK